MGILNFRHLGSLLRLAGYLITLIVGASSSALASESQEFSYVLKHSPSSIWAPKLDSKTKASVRAYDSRSKLKNHLEYGKSVRDFDLSRLCDAEIKSWAAKLGCQEKDDVIKSPVDNLPVHDSKGETIPLISWVCPDGGVIRMKPKGDSTQPKYSKPSVVKALRFFGSDRYDNFSDEAFKVDNQGRAVPKWGKDLNTSLPGLENEAVKKDFIEAWGKDSHTDLKICR